RKSHRTKSIRAVPIDRHGSVLEYLLRFGRQPMGIALGKGLLGLLIEKKIFDPGAPEFLASFGLIETRGRVENVEIPCNALAIVDGLRPMSPQDRIAGVGSDLGAG